LAYLDKVFKHVTTPIYSSRIRQDQLKFFLEANQSLAWVPACCDEELWVTILCILILVINMRPCYECFIISQLEVLLDLFFCLLEFSWDGFIAVQGVLELDPIVLLFELRDFLLFGVQVLFAKANVLPDHI